MVRTTGIPAGPAFERRTLQARANRNEQRPRALQHRRQRRDEHVPASCGLTASTTIVAFAMAAALSAVAVTPKSFVSDARAGS